MIPGHPFPGQNGHEETTDYLCVQRQDGVSNPAVLPGQNPQAWL
jgi:hypothetical protein